jgi:hypothetical protein
LHDPDPDPQHCLVHLLSIWNAIAKSATKISKGAMNKVGTGFQQRSELFLVFLECSINRKRRNKCSTPLKIAPQISRHHEDFFARNWHISPKISAPLFT